MRPVRGSVGTGVAAVSFAPACRPRFQRRKDTGWERGSLEATLRSAYLRRVAPPSIWEHSIPAVEHLRYLVTLRTLAANTGL
jgi:hypothetical protein